MRRFLHGSIFALLVSMGSAGALTLDEALQETLEHNPTILGAKTQLEQAAGYRLTLHAVTWPQARLGVVLGLQGGKRSGEASTQPFAFARGVFTQPLFNAAIPPSRRRGDVALLVAQQQFNVAVSEQLHRARIAFLTALYSRELESLRRSQREALDANIKSQEALYEAGVGQRNLLIGATLLARELDPRVEAALRSYRGALVELHAAMGAGLDAGTQLRDPSGSLAMTTTRHDLARATEATLKRRPDLELARRLVQSAREEYRIALAGYYPALTAVVAGDYIPVSETRRGNEGTPQRSDDIISSEVRTGVTYTWRVIDNGEVGGAAHARKETARANEAQLARLEATVPNELARLEAELRAIAARHRAFSAAAEDAGENAEMIRRSLAEGLASVLDFRGAESNLLDARSGLLSAAYQHQVTLAEWDLATGRYLEFSKDTTGKLD